MTAPTNRYRGKRSWKQTNFLTKSERLPTRRKHGRERGYANKGVERTRKLNARGIERRTGQTRHVPASVKASAGASPHPSKRQRKLELMEQAQRAGWRGRTYKGAKQFEDALERRVKVKGQLSTRHLPRKRSGWRRWLAKGKR